MAYDEGLARRVRRALGRYRGLREIRMFGGLCFTLRGNMVVGVLDGELVVRLPKGEEAAALTDPDLRPMDLTGKPMKGFCLVRRSGLKTARQLRTWVERCAACVCTLPPKE